MPVCMLIITAASSRYEPALQESRLVTRHSVARQTLGKFSACWSDSVEVTWKRNGGPTQELFSVSLYGSSAWPGLESCRLLNCQFLPLFKLPLFSFFSLLFQ